MPPPATPPGNPTYVIWCPVCGRSEPIADDEWERHAREGWPLCCGRTMWCHYSHDRDLGSAPRSEAKHPAG